MNSFTVRPMRPVPSIAVPAMDGAANLFTHKVELSTCETLLVLTATVPTFRLPTFISTRGVGHLVAEGLIFSADGTVCEAPYESMWDWRLGVGVAIPGCSRKSSPELGLLVDESLDARVVPQGIAPRLPRDR